LALYISLKQACPNQVTSGSELCMGRLWGPVSKIGNPWGPIGEIANISFQIKFSVTRCISPESFCNSVWIPELNSRIPELNIEIGSRFI
jgi:hypothetical protein